MAISNDDALEQRYRALFENEGVTMVVDARTPNDAAPIDEQAILEFVRASDEKHATYVRSVFRRFGGSETAE